jgi:hypothetical protein
VGGEGGGVLVGVGEPSGLESSKTGNASDEAVVSESSLVTTMRQAVGGGRQAVGGGRRT